MWYLLVPLIVLIGISAKYAIASPLRRLLAIPVDMGDDENRVAPKRQSSIGSDWPGLTTEMASEWIRDCRSDAV